MFTNLKTKITKTIKLVEINYTTEFELKNNDMFMKILREAIFENSDILNSVRINCTYDGVSPEMTDFDFINKSFILEVIWEDNSCSCSDMNDDGEVTAHCKYIISNQEIIVTMDCTWTSSKF